MLTKETFIKAINAIRKHEELMDRLDAICREFGDFRPCLDFGNLHLQALLAVLKEAMNDQDDYISWWLYDGGDRIVSWEENGQKVSVDLTDVNALYCFFSGAKCRMIPPRFSDYREHKLPKSKVRCPNVHYILHLQEKRVRAC